MSYEPTIWKKGDKVTSTKLNKIENGIQGNDEEITSIKEGLNAIQTATASDVGKALKAKTVTDGKVSEWEFGAVDIQVDSTLSPESENPVQNKVLYNELNIVERTVIPSEPITYLNGNTNTPIGYIACAIALNVGADEPIYIENIDVRATSGKTVKFGFFSFRRISDDPANINYNRGYFTLLEWIAEVTSVDTHAVYTPETPILYNPIEKHLLAVAEDRTIGYITNVSNGINALYTYDRPLFYSAQVGVEINDPSRPASYIMGYSPTPTWQGTYTSPSPQGAYSITYETQDSEPTIITTVTNVKDAVEELINAEPPVIPNGYNPLYGKKWAACGDSVTMGVEEVNVDGVYWTYEQFISQRNGMTLYKDGISGTTMAVSNPSDISYKLPFSVDRYKDVPTDCDYITIWFGINDNTLNVPIGTISDTVNTTFYGAYNKVLKYLITNIPNAKIGLVVSHMISSDMATAIRNIAKKYGLLVFDIPADEKIPFWSPDSSAITADVDATIKAQRTAQWWVNPSHPSIKGYEYISYPFENWMRSL